METSPMQSHRTGLKFGWLAAGLALVNLSPSLTGAQTPQSGIQATAASLALPAGIAFDSAGNLYLADLNHHIIREVWSRVVWYERASEARGQSIRGQLTPWKDTEIVVGVAVEGDLLDVCLPQCLKGKGINPS